MSKHTNIKERVLDHTWLKSIIKYIPETGKFYWYTPRNGLAFLGKQAGSLKNKKHTAIGIAGRTYMAHRLAFFYMTGAWPKNLIDHINMNGTDNRWCNLREATSAENNFNKIIDNRQGFRGIRLNSYPEGCSCGAYKHNSLVSRLAAAQARIADLEALKDVRDSFKKMAFNWQLRAEKAESRVAELDKELNYEHGRHHLTHERANKAEGRVAVLEKALEESNAALVIARFTLDRLYAATGPRSGPKKETPMTIDYKAKCERLTAVIESVLGDLVGEKMITQNEVYDRLHTAVYGEQFEKEAE